MVKNFIHQLLKLIYPLFERLMPFQFFAYLAVGAFNTAINIALFALLYQAVLPQEGWYTGGIQIASYTISLVLSFLFTVPTGYWLSKHFAFSTGKQSAKETGAQLGKYFLVVLQGLLSDYLLMKAMIEWVSVHPTIAKIISTVVVLTVNFLLQKYFTFKKTKPVAL